MFVWLAAVMVALVVVAVVHDVVARRRGTYRSSAEWHAISRRRKGHLRELRQRRSEDAQRQRRQ